MISASLPIRIGAPKGKRKEAFVVVLELYTEKKSALSWRERVIVGGFAFSCFFVKVMLYPSAARASRM